MINLNDFLDQNNNEERKAIFNDGEAGRVQNVRVRIARRTAEEKATAPPYKIYYIDDNGGEVNDGIYYPDDSGKGNPKFALSRLVQLLHAINPSLVGKELPEFDDYKPAVDFLMEQIAKASKTGRVNVFVNYGTKGYPSQYLNVRKINFVEPVGVSDNLTKLRVAVNKDSEKSTYDDVMSRIQETSFEEDSFKNNVIEDLPADDDLGWD